MGIISQAIARVLEQDPPFFSPEKCLNRRQTRHPCTICHDRCTGGALPKNPVTEKIDWNKCIGCGICVTACPTRCFAPDLKQQRNMTAPIKGEMVSFACAHTKEPVGERRVECLSAVPWEWLAVLALRTSVQLYTGECGECAVESCREQLLENLALLKLFLGDERFESRVILQDDLSVMKRQEERRVMDRRAILGMLGRNMKTKAASSAASITPSLGDEQIRNGFAYRILLANTLRNDCLERAGKSGEERPAYASYRVLLPRFGAKCHGCGVCARICPNQALSIEKENEHSSIISIEPMKCTACELCRKVCPHGGIIGFEENTVHHLQMQGHARVRHKSCIRCGESIPADTEDGMCIACSAKYGKLKRK